MPEYDASDKYEGLVDLYYQLLGFNNYPHVWGKFYLKKYKGKKTLMPVKKGSHRIKKWFVDEIYLDRTRPHYFWHIYFYYGIFK